MMPGGVQVLRSAQQALTAGDAAGAQHLLDRGAALLTDGQRTRMQAAIWWQVGRQEEALALLEEAAASESESALAFGQGLLALGRAPQAARALQEAAVHFPSSVDVWFLLGRALYERRDDPGALAAFERAHALAPGAPEIRRAVAESHFALGAFSQARAHFEQLSASAGMPSPDLELRLVQCRRRDGDISGALAAVESALVRHARFAPLWLERGWLAEDAGDAQGAAAAYMQAIAIAPDWADPIGSVLKLQGADADDDVLQRAQAIAVDARRGSAERAFVAHALGRHADLRSDYDAAMSHWDLANKLRRGQDGPFDRDAHRAAIDALIAELDAPTLKRLHARAIPDPRPVFIVGMPRSGTTLVEQILAAHRAVHGCGERTTLAAIAAEAAVRSGWPSHPEGLEPSWCAQQARAYLEAGAHCAPADAVRLVDKQPYNYLHVGLISALFSSARVLWCRRDPRDIAVSIYSENFAGSETYATDLSDIAFVIGEQERLMRHWQRASPLEILEVPYEDVVQAPEQHMRRLIEFLALDWDPACLDFHASGRAVQTVSRWQVRQPLHSRSVGRWRRYAHWFPAP